MPKREHFGGIFGAFSGPGAKSVFRSHSLAIFTFSGFQGTLKSSVFDVFSEAAPSTCPEGTLGRTF